MFAVVETGGKQYKLNKGDIIDIEKIEGEAGAKVELDKVLLTADSKSIKVGTPTVEGAKVSVTIVEQARDKKVVVFKYKNKTGYRRTKGHRQSYTRIKVDKITGKEKAVKEKATETTEKTAEAA